MSDFTFTVKGDVQQTLRDTDKVEENLVGIEGKAKDAGDAMTRAFAGAGAAARDTNGRFQAASVATDNLRSRLLLGATAADSFVDKLRATSTVAGQQLAASNLAAGFGQLGSHLQRVTDVVERIHGPMREHMQDMAALATAYRQGMISAREFTEEQARLRGQLAQRTSVGSQVAGGILQGAGVSGLVQGGVAGVAAAATTHAIGLARDAVDLADSYTALENRVRQVTRSEADRQNVMERTLQIANASRAEWNATGELFVRLTNATKDMGLSQGHVLRLTETISKAFAQSGASASEASAGMLQLSQALASGRLQGDEFRTLAEAMPSLLDIFAQKLGVTRGALKQMGADGKITADVIVAAFDDAGASIDRGFAQSMPTLSQQMTVFKNQMEATFGPLLQRLLPMLGEYLTSIAEHISSIVSMIEKAAGELGKLPGSSTARGVAGDAYSAGRTLFDPTKQTSRIVDYADESAAAIRTAQTWAEAARLMEEKFGSADEVIIQMTKELNQLHETLKNPPPVDEWAGDFGTQIKHLMEVTRDLPTEVERANNAWDNSTKVLEKGTQGLFDFGKAVDDMLAKGIGQLVGVDITANVIPPLDEWLRKLGDIKNAHANMAGAVAGTLPAVGNAITRAGVIVAAKLGEMNDNYKRSWQGFQDDGKKGISELEKLFRSIVDPMRNFERDLKNLDILFKAGRISISQYHDTLDKLAEQFKGSSDWRIANVGQRENQAWMEIQMGAAAALDAAADYFRFVREQRAAEANAPSGLDWELDIQKAKDAKARSAELFDFQQRLRTGPEARSGWVNASALGASGTVDAEKAAILTRRWNEQLEHQKKLWQDVDQFGQQAIGHVEDAIVSAASTGKASFSDMMQSIFRDLERLAAHRLLMWIVGGIGGGGLGGGYASALGTGATQSFPGMFSPGGGHEHGGSFRFGGSGGPDSQLAIVRGTPGESVEFKTKSDQAAESRAGGFEAHFHYDPYSLVGGMRSSRGRKQTVSIIREERNAIRRILR